MASSGYSEVQQTEPLEQEMEPLEEQTKTNSNPGLNSNPGTSEPEGQNSNAVTDQDQNQDGAADPVLGHAHVVSMEEFQRSLTQGNANNQDSGGENSQLLDKKERWCGSRRCFLALVIGLVVLIVFIVVVTVIAGKHGASSGTHEENEAEDGAETYQQAAVVTDVEICSVMGKEILEQGGSAVDAAITSQLCVGLVNGQSSGLGGGFFMVIYDTTDNSSRFLDAREVAPAAANEAYAAYQRLADSRYGINFTGVPGEVSGLWSAHQMYGKLAWSDLFQPVIQLAEKGYMVTDHTDDTLQRLSKTKPLSEYPGNWDIYTNADGTPKRKDDVLYNHALAQTFRALAANGSDEFYSGETARRLVEEIQSFGGIITMDDLAAYEVKWSQILSSTFGDYTLLTSSLPSGGPILQFIINVMQAFGLSQEDFASEAGLVLTYHRFIEASKFAFALRSHLGDAQTSAINNILALLSSPEYANEVAASIPSDAVTHTNISYYDVAPDVTSTLGGTSHISVLAPNGDAVSLTSSVNYRFGSRVRSETGIIYNNQMADFSFSPSSPNFVSPGRRPISSMCGSVVLGPDGRVMMVEGSAGSKRIITANAWIMLSVLLGKVPLAEAIDKPRLHCQLNPDVYIDYEQDFPEEIIEGLEALGHSLTDTRYFSVVEAILRQDGVIRAYSDPRKQPGKPAGF